MVRLDLTGEVMYIRWYLYNPVEHFQYSRLYIYKLLSSFLEYIRRFVRIVASHMDVYIFRYQEWTVANIDKPVQHIDCFLNIQNLFDKIDLEMKKKN